MYWGGPSWNDSLHRVHHQSLWKAPVSMAKAQKQLACRKRLRPKICARRKSACRVGDHGG
jgi:hypothetical protein